MSEFLIFGLVSVVGVVLGLVVVTVLGLVAMLLNRSVAVRLNSNEVELRVGDAIPQSPAKQDLNESKAWSELPVKGDEALTDLAA